MKLLHVTPFYEPAWAYGGMARAASGLCRALARRGHEVTVATAVLHPSDRRDETADGVRVLRFPGPRFLQRWLVPWGRGLGSFLRSELAGVHLAHLHGHRNGFALTACSAFEAAAIPWVLQPHGTLPHHGQHPFAKRLFDRLVGERIVSGASTLVAVSEAEAGDLPRPAQVVANGVEAPGQSLRRADTEGPRLLFVGTDRPQKRGSVLPELLRALPDGRLHLVGVFGPRFRRLFRDVASRVTVDGVLDGGALAAAYAAADLVVHPSVGEAFGLVPFEAALLGTAAVVADGHGCGEWFRRAGGCVVPADDPGALLEAVSYRLRAPAKALDEALAVAAFARRELTWDHAAQAMEPIYEEAVSRRGRGAA